MEIRKMDEKGMHLCYRLKDGKETVKDALLHFVLTGPLKKCFSAQARPFPMYIDVRQLEEEVHIPPKDNGQVVARFVFANVHCDLEITQRRDDSKKFDYSYLSGKYVGTITTNFSASGH